MRPEEQRLINDLLGDDGRRETTLLAGAQALRRRRHRRVAARGVALVLALVVSVVGFERMNLRRQSGRSVVPVSVASEPAQPHSLTDDELLALFPNTPVGLATLADGRKRLIFPRSGDEQRFITRL